MNTASTLVVGAIPKIPTPAGHCKFTLLRLALPPSEGGIDPTGALVTPGSQRLHDYLVDMDTIAIISDEMRVVIDNEWPELVQRL